MKVTPGNLLLLSLLIELRSQNEDFYWGGLLVFEDFKHCKNHLHRLVPKGDPYHLPWLGIGDLVSGGREVNKRNSMKKGGRRLKRREIIQMWRSSDQYGHAGPNMGPMTIKLFERADSVDKG
ncbi:hypothetical protein NC651_008272 [Populus alba x Populus x berolinensis]|nr:hypothetical protein NC651_008272 [Populus alba x Populus x berolinensis]